MIYDLSICQLVRGKEHSLCGMLVGALNFILFICIWHVYYIDSLDIILGCKKSVKIAITRLLQIVVIRSSIYFAVNGG